MANALFWDLVFNKTYFRVRIVIWLWHLAKPNKHRTTHYGLYYVSFLGLLLLFLKAGILLLCTILLHVKKLRFMIKPERITSINIFIWFVMSGDLSHDLGWQIPNHSLTYEISY